MTNGKSVCDEIELSVDAVAPQATGASSSAEDDETAKWRAELRKIGVYTPEMLAATVKRQANQQYLIDGLLRPKSINLLVGNSGLGKTPLGIQLGLSVAAGVRFLDRVARQGKVLYCDAESDPQTLYAMLRSISSFLQLQREPDDFLVWSPHWESRIDLDESFASTGKKLITRVYGTRPALVIVDPLRMFWPDAESANDEAAKMIDVMRRASKETGCAWLITHHRRKVSQHLSPGRLDEDPHGWFQEASGAHALVNNSDSRIGAVEPHSGRADLLLGGFMRTTGAFTPLDLARVTNENDDPVGYRLLTGIDQLSDEQRFTYQRLSAVFRFKDVLSAMGGTSASSATNLLKKCISLKIVEKDGGCYRKTSQVVERVEQVENASTGTPLAPSTPANGRPSSVKCGDSPDV